MPATTSKTSSAVPTAKKTTAKSAGKPTKADGKSEATGLSKTLGLKSGHTMVLIDAPSTFTDSLDLPNLSKMGIDLHTAARRGVEFDVAVLFVPTNKMLTARLGPLSKSMKAGGSLWVAFPKKTSGMSTDLSDEHVKRIGGAIGTVEGKPSAFDKTWSAMRVVIADKA